MHTNMHIFSQPGPLITFVDTFLKNCLLNFENEIINFLGQLEVLWRFNIYCMYAGSFLPPISCCTFPDSSSSDISSPSKRPHIPLLPPPPPPLLLHLLIRYPHSGGSDGGGGGLRGPAASPIFWITESKCVFPKHTFKVWVRLTMSWNPCANLMHFLRLPYSHLNHYYFKSIELGFWFLI